MIKEHPTNEVLSKLPNTPIELGACNIFNKIKVLLTFIVIASIISCSKTSVSSKITIGQKYQGGVVGYIDGSGLHGLIVGPINSRYWHSTNSGVTGANGSDIGTGRDNTNAIVAFYGKENSAASYCYDLVLNGYDDWYLPSKDELNQLYINKNTIGGFTKNAYWSSTESNDFAAWDQSFTTGNQTRYDKSAVGFFCAVRSF